MKWFWFGVVVAVLLIPVIGLGYVRWGFVDPRADIPVNTLDRAIAMPALDASVDRRAPELKNPAAPSVENLSAAMWMYQQRCASCHGDPAHPQAELAQGLYPRAPQFLEDAPDMSDDQNFYILQHGIRYSGMPAWKPVLTDWQLWQITTFLSQMDKLPGKVRRQWLSAARLGSEMAPPNVRYP